MVLEAIFPELNAGWFPFLIAELSGGRHGSINFNEKVNFFKMFGITAPFEQILRESAICERRAIAARPRLLLGKWEKAKVAFDQKFKVPCQTRVLSPKSQKLQV
jgi:hypothetical protein